MDIISSSPIKNQRNWLDLPCDVTLTILKKLEVSEILKSAQFVCKSWYVLCKEPFVRNTIRLYDFGESESDLQFEEEKYTGIMIIGNSLTDVGLTAILDGCPRLQSLDLRACFHIELVGNLGKRLLEQIKDFRRPYDSTDDYNYRTRFYNSSDSSDDDYTYESDYVKRLISLMSDDDLESELDYFY
ncbi:F-box protein SKIP19-like [Silene latifolia]|uniref:F-box protein SKIP19-like n=1 Tax=Silene latifolia TaxID=37657 RepID=UPI003D76C8C8